MATYWTKQTDEKIHEYNLEVDDVKRNQIFNEFIYPALLKLSECTFNANKFSYTDDPLDVQQECVSHLTTILFRYKKGLNGFGYFGTAAKYYFIQLNRTGWKDLNRNVSIDATAHSNTEDNETDSSHIQLVAKTNDTESVREGMKLRLEKFLNMPGTFFTVNSQSSTNARKLVNMIRETFDNIDDIDLDTINKHSIFKYMKAQSGMKTSQISRLLMKMRKHDGQEKNWR